MPTVTNNITVSAVGASILNSADPSAVSWIRVNADNTISYRTAAQTLSDLGAQGAGTYLVPGDIGVTVQGYNASTTILGNSVTGSGSIVLATSPTIATSFTLDYGTASTVVYLNASKQLISLANGSGVLTNDGAGGLSWAASSSGITINSTAITGGGANRILFENSSNQVSESATNFYFQTATPFNHVFAAGRSGTITGVNNTLFGYRAGGALTSTARNTFIGTDAGKINIGSDNVAIGSNAFEQSGTPFVNNNNTFIGSFAGNTMNGANANDNTGIGYRALAANQGRQNVGIGYEAYYSTTQDYCIGIGYRAQGAHNSCIIIGKQTAYSNTTAANQGILGSNDSNGYISDWYFNGVTHTAPYSVVLHASHGSGTNVNAANFTISGGAATGTGNAGFVKSTTSVKRASGTTQQVDTDRNIIVGKYVDITGGAATTFGQLALATSGTNAGGEVLYTIEANDGTDYQSLTGVLKYDVVNKAGTLTVTYSDVQNGAGACSAGTLTATVTAVVSGTSIQFQANAVSSLSETVLRVSFQVINNFGVATISPA